VEGWLPEHWSTSAILPLPPNLRLDGRTGRSQPCSTGSSCQIGCRTGHGRLAGSGGARWRWASLVLRDHPMLSHTPSYRNPVTLMGETPGSAPCIPCPPLGLRGGWGAGLPNFIPLSWLLFLLTQGRLHESVHALNSKIQLMKTMIMTEGPPL